MKQVRNPRWQSYAEYQATQQYTRCIGRILVDLPPYLRREGNRTLARGAVTLGQCIAGAHAELPEGMTMETRDREEYRDIGLAIIAASRSAIRLLHMDGRASRAELMVAAELLERIEQGLTGRPLPT